MKTLAGVLLSLSVLLSCATPPPKKSLLEVRAMQTRAYETDDTLRLMKALVLVLQDEAFLVQDASVDMGLLCASKQERADVEDTQGMPEQGQSGATPVSIQGFSFTLGGTDYVPTRIVECTANVSERGKQLRVRIAFSKTVLDAKGKVFKAGRIEDESYYQRFFARLDEALVTPEATR